MRKSKVTDDKLVKIQHRRSVEGEWCHGSARSALYQWNSIAARGGQPLAWHQEGRGYWVEDTATGLQPELPHGPDLDFDL